MAVSVKWSHSNADRIPAGTETEPILRPKAIEQQGERSGF